jgi:hypothetical protein
VRSEETGERREERGERRQERGDRREEIERRVEGLLLYPILVGDFDIEFRMTCELGDLL